MTQTILRIDASMRRAGSVTRELTDKVLERLDRDRTARVIGRDLAGGLPQIDEAWIDANFTEADDRTPDQRAALALSDRLVAELQTADTVVIGMPVYNFGVPAALKAWIDQVARARVTFRYTPEGPVGLLEGKRAVIVAASGGTGIDSEIDFATPYLRHVLGFIGIEDVTVIVADRQMGDPDAAREKADKSLAALAA